jgi:uncharacterized membrane protein
MSIVTFVAAHWVTIVVAIVTIERAVQIILNLVNNPRANAIFQQIESVLSAFGIRISDPTTTAATNSAASVSDAVAAVEDAAKAVKVVIDASKTKTQ